MTRKVRCFLARGSRERERTRERLLTYLRGGDEALEFVGPVLGDSRFPVCVSALSGDRDALRQFLRPIEDDANRLLGGQGLYPVDHHKALAVE